MAKDSCINHTQSSYYVELREDFVNLFDGDHCAGVILSLFEFMTNNKLAEFRLASEDDKEPWVKASMSRIYEETLGLYSIRALQSRIDFIENCGLIKIDDKAGFVKRYLLDFRAVSEAIKTRRIYNYKDPGNFAGVAGPSAKPSAKKTENDPVLNLKVVSSILDHPHTVEPAPVAYKENQNPDRTVSMCWGILKRARPKPATRWDKQKECSEKSLLKEFISEQAEQYSQDDIMDGLNRYTEDPHWLEKGLPVAGFRSQFNQFVNGRTNGAFSAPIAPSASNRVSSQSQNGSRSGHTLFAGQEEEFVTDCNRIVQSAPAVTKGDFNSPEWRRILTGEAAQEPLRTKILEKLEQVISGLHETQKGEAWFLTISAMFLGGKYSKLLRGEYDYLLRPKMGSDKKTKAMSALDQAMAKYNRKEEK